MGVSCCQSAASGTESAPYASVMNSWAKKATMPTAPAATQTHGATGQPPVAKGSPARIPPRVKAKKMVGALSVRDRLPGLGARLGERGQRGQQGEEHEPGRGAEGRRHGLG